MTIEGSLFTIELGCSKFMVERYCQEPSNGSMKTVATSLTRFVSFNCYFYLRSCNGGRPMVVAHKKEFLIRRCREASRFFDLMRDRRCYLRIRFVARLRAGDCWFNIARKGERGWWLWLKRLSWWGA